MKYLYVAIAITLALGGWGLYQQINENGRLQEKLKALQRDLDEQVDENERIQKDLEERDQLILTLRGDIEALNKRAEKAKTIIREVYHDPDPEVALQAREWAETEPPHAVQSAAALALDCLWNSPSAASKDCMDKAPSTPDARLP